MSVDNAAEVGRFIRSTWWLVLLRGIFAIVLGVLAFVWPVGITIAFVWVFAIYAIVDGIVAIVQSLATRRVDPGWGWLFALGIVGILAGIAAIVFPLIAGALALITLLWAVAIWALVSGIVAIPAAASLTDGQKTLGIVTAVMSILFAVLLAILLFATPASAIVGLIFVLGGYAVLVGIVLIVVAVRAQRAVTR